MLRSLITRTEGVLIKVSEDLSWAAKIAAVLFAFFAPLGHIVGIMAVFLLLDTASAIYLSFKIRRKRCVKKGQSTTVYRFRCMRLLWSVIDPDKLSRTTEKLFAYPAIAIGCFVFDSMVLGVEPADGSVGRFSLTNLSFILICFTDFKSFLRNMGKATGNELYKMVENLLDRKMGQKFGNDGTKN